MRIACPKSAEDPTIECADSSFGTYEKHPRCCVPGNWTVIAAMSPVSKSVNN